MNATAHPHRKSVLRLAATALCIIALASTWSATGSCSAETVPGPGSAIAAGFGYSLLIGAGGSVWGWGGNDSHEVNGDMWQVSYAPRRVGISGVVAVAAGDSLSMALTGDGAVWQWGKISERFGKSVFLHVPTRVLGLPRARAISAGGDHSMALCSDGTVWTWGQNGYGQLGGGDAEYRAIPGVVEGLSNVVAIDAGSDSCISLKADGTVWTWGYRSEFDSRGRSTYSRQPVPLAVELPDRALAVEAGGSHYLVVLPGGEVWAWGDNYGGQIGGSPELYEHPVRVQGLPPCAAVSAGDSFSLALGQDGSIWAWGANHSGQLGLGHMRKAAVPTKVERLNGIIAIASGSDHALALGADGTVWELGAKRLLFPLDVTYNLLWPTRVDTRESGVCLLP